jgi:predicted nucleic acid-binding protein
MLVVSDTSPTSALLQIGRAELLKDLFDAVCIPPAVNDESRAISSGAAVVH